ncbi:MAG: lipoate--protein ligase family protein [Chlamydiota bacterium]|nr:lipoate--protein ligase family protein [Chlamydiota bacterium]
MKPTLYYLPLRGLSIYEQLCLEEKLLRGTDTNWILYQEGTLPAIVMGVSGKEEEWIERERWRASPLPIIRRYSGGGTVVVDEETLFLSFLFRGDAHAFPLYPEAIMRWSASLYRQALPQLGLSLRGEDYAIGDRKCGGNAQYIQRGRFVHHSTFLWDYDPGRMSLLKQPPRMPTYRQGRSHGDFLGPLRHHLPSKESLIQGLLSHLSHHYTLLPGHIPQELPPLRQATRCLHYP